MSKITSQLFYNRFTGTGGGGVPYLPVGWNGPCICVTQGYFSWDLTTVRLRFSASDDSIAMLNDSDGRTFIDQKFKVGDDITVTGTTSNNGDFTIEEISEDGRTIYVAESLTDEDEDEVNVYGVTPVETVDYLYNLIENSASETYYSIVDPTSQQRYTIENFDASDEIHTLNFRVLTKSRAWVPNVLSDETTGETEECTILGSGISEYRQYFEIEHRFFVTPFYLSGQYSNFADRTAPEYYQGEKSLKYITRIEGRYESNTPDADQYITKTNVNGVGSWADQANFGRLPEYYVSAIGYSIDGDDATEFDVVKDADVTITFKSRTGRFVNSAGKFILSFGTCPSDPSDYQETETTLLQNFFFDGATAVEGVAPVNGLNFGTDYQVITDCTFTYVDANTVTAEFTYSPGDALVEYWQDKADNDRFYFISIQTEDPTVTTTKASDSVPCRADFKSAAWDKTDDTLFRFTGSGLYHYAYPDNGVYGTGDANVFEGDPGFWVAPFAVPNDPDADGNTPTIKSITAQIIAYKTDRDDFILEEKVIDCEGFRKLDDVQQLSVDETRGFITYEDDPRNIVSLVRDEDNDTGTEAAYVFSYGYIARYEDWISASDSRTVNADGVNSIPDVEKEIENITQRWANYSDVNGWNLKYRFTIVITGTDGNDNTYFSDGDMTVLTSNQIDWSGIDPSATQTLQFFTEDGDTEISCLARDAKSLIRVTYTGDFPEPVDASGYYAQMVAVLEESSIFEQRFASTEIESEEGSPFSPTDADPDADESYANGNLRINIFRNLISGDVEEITVECYFDSSFWGNTDYRMLFYPRLGVKYIST